MQTKRAYESPSPADGERILVDRIWPRGVTKDALKVDLWLKGAAPSTGLRQWYGHDPARWQEFLVRYFRELDADPNTWKPILEAAAKGPVTLIYAARDTEHNNAIALAKYLENAGEEHGGSTVKKVRKKHETKA